MVLSISIQLVVVVKANTFLKASPVDNQERIRQEDIERSLFTEIEGTFGEGSAATRFALFEDSLTSMFAALPKNEHGNLGRSTVRYALHRLFVQRHGWFLNGLHDAGGHRNVSSDGLLKEEVPAYIQDLFESVLAGKGFGLHELAVVAATIEHFVHQEAIKQLQDAFNLHEHAPTAELNEKEVDQVMDTYMMAYILNENLANLSHEEAADLKDEMPDVFLAWNATRRFVHDVRINVTRFESNAEQKKSGLFDFSLVARIAERVGERFGRFQDLECKQIRSSLYAIEESGTGRVRLSDFYKPALDGSWQFQESQKYLRQLGALDESDPQNPRVIIANYISSPSNCIASSSFYSVCCIDECEGLLGHLEQQIAAPEATAEQIVRLVTKMPSSSMVAPRVLSKTLLNRLLAIDEEHGGKVPLHGRLFAQWMHHAFPRECPYPHVAGTTNPQTPDEWLDSTGEDTTASMEDIQALLDNAQNSSQEELDADFLPWSPEEELLVVRPGQDVQGAKSSSLRTVVLFAAMASLMYGLVHSTSGSKGQIYGVSMEKMHV